MLTEHQRVVIDFFLRNGVGYVGYPAAIERGTRQKVNRVSARDLCERLTRMQIMERFLARSPNRASRTPHYRLKNDSKSFILLVREYIKSLVRSDPLSWQDKAFYFMQTDFTRQRITTCLVRTVLSSKGVGMQLAIPLGKSRSFSRFAGLFLPVAPPEASKLPKHTLLMKPESLSRDEARHIIAEVEKHYLSAEDHVLVLPILALIEISPTALLFFIGKWRPYKTDSIVFRLNSSGLEMVEHVLFRLIWGAINDLAVFRGVPERCDVTMAFVNRENPVPNSAKPLLSLYWKYKAVIEYDAGFDTLHEYYGGEDNDAVEIERNPENAWVTVKWIDEPVKERSNNLEVHGKN